MIKKQYVTTARAKGVPENTVLYRYPVRIAVNPIISTVGWVLPAVVGGEVLVSIVLKSLPTTCGRMKSMGGIQTLMADCVLSI